MTEKLRADSTSPGEDVAVNENDPTVKLAAKLEDMGEEVIEAAKSGSVNDLKYDDGYFGTFAEDARKPSLIKRLFGRRSPAEDIAPVRTGVSTGEAVKGRDSSAQFTETRGSVFGGQVVRDVTVREGRDGEKLVAVRSRRENPDGTVTGRGGEVGEPGSRTMISIEGDDEVAVARRRASRHPKATRDTADLIAARVARKLTSDDKDRYEPRNPIHPEVAKEGRRQRAIRLDREARAEAAKAERARIARDIAEEQL